MAARQGERKEEAPGEDVLSGGDYDSRKAGAGHLAQHSAGGKARAINPIPLEERDHTAE